MHKAIPVLLKFHARPGPIDEIRPRPPEHEVRTVLSPAEEEERFREIEDLYLSGILRGIAGGSETRH